MTATVRTIFLLTLVIIGVISTAEGSRIYLKAILAQYLLEIAGKAKRYDKPTQVNKSDPIIGLHQALQRCVIYRCSVPRRTPFLAIAHDCWTFRTKL